jgi:hypothetical protein
MLALLRAAESGPAQKADAVARLMANLAIAHEPEPVDRNELERRLAEASAMLEAAGAIDRCAKGGFQLTRRGADLLRDHPEGVDGSLLATFPEFQAWLEARQLRETEDDPRTPAYRAGVRAFNEGRLLTDNPFPFDHPDHLAWECGWSEARDG